jgi:uncharacterized membrane protein YraQ (UPF0718 family)
MNWSSFWASYGEAAKTAVGFFWKAGWAFVLGYAVSAMIQAFVPKKRLTRYMGGADVKSILLATGFGAASSSCSFAALAAARSLVMKGAHFVAAVAFMFASTNLVIELGILILIFLGWPFLAAEIVGGVVMIAVSSALIKITYPARWLQAARSKVEEESPDKEADFDWRERIASREGWLMVGNHFVSDWLMVWEEIIIGFTIAGFVAVLVPTGVWETLFLLGDGQAAAGWLVALENAIVAPFVAAATFIGSMGNIPLATVLNANGVLFAGIMGFIYSDLMVPPLVMVNAKYYGWRVAIYIAGIMFVSIVITALSMHVVFGLLGWTPESGRQVGDVAQFDLDYTFYMNLAFGAVALVMIRLHRKWKHREDGGSTKSHDHGGGISLKRAAALAAAAILLAGMAAYGITGS